LDGGLLWVRWWTLGFLRHGVSYPYAFVVIIQLNPLVPITVPSSEIPYLSFAWLMLPASPISLLVQPRFSLFNQFRNLHPIFRARFTHRPHQDSK
jgi:hypothetical protein